MKLNIQLFASVSSSKYDGRYLKLTATETATSIENNTSTIHWKFESIGGNDTYYSIYEYGVYYNGIQLYDTSTGGTLKSKNYTNHTFPVTKGSVEGDITIEHNADGTAANVSFAMFGSVYKNKTNQYDLSLPLTTIPRASQPRLSSSNVNMGTTITIYTDRVSTTFTHTIRYWFGNANGTIGTNVTDSVSWTPSVDLANQIPSATSGYGTIYCDTYSNGTLIGTKTIDFTLNVPSNVVPSVSFTNVSEAGDVPSSWGVYVKTKSRIALAISGSGVYGSTISSYKISYYGGEVLTQSTTTSYLTQAGSTTFTGQVTDTRGRSASTTTTINVVDYYNPTISTAQVQRCDANGNIDNNGEYMYISYGASISSCSNKNTPSAVYKVGYRVHNTGNYTYVNLTTNANSYSANGMLFSDGIKAASSSGTKVQFSTSNTYDIIFYVKDYFMEYTNVQSLDTGFDLMNFNPSGKSMAIGKVSEASASEELFEVGIPTKIDDMLNVTGDIGANGVKTKFIELGGYQMSTPFIDFHYENDFSVDYTARIIEFPRGTIRIDGKFEPLGAIVSPDVYLKPIGNRLLYYGSIQYTNLWADVVKYYSIVENYSWQTLRNGYKRWFRFLVWKNDNATSEVGLQLGLFDQSGNYKGGYNIARSWGSGTNEWGSYFTSTFIGLDTLNIGWTQIKAIIPSGSNGTSGYIFSLSIEAYDIPTGIDPNNL